MQKLYKDLYKMEPGEYIMRCDPSLIPHINSLVELCRRLAKEKHININIILAPKDAIEFIPKKKGKKCLNIPS